LQQVKHQNQTLIMDIEHYTQPNQKASMHAINLAGLCREFKANEIGIEAFSISILEMLNDMHEVFCEYAKTQTDAAEKIEELEEEVSDLKQEIEDAEDCYSQEEFSDLEDQISDLELEISDLEDQILDLEEKIKEIAEIAEISKMSGNAKGRKILEIINN
jgi:chromosome segregation ATPase